jgi:hypothetical protein
MNTLFVGLLIAPFLGLITGYIAWRKGDSFWSFWFFGTALFIIALPYTIFVLKTDEGELEYRKSQKTPSGARLDPSVSTAILADTPPSVSPPDILEKIAEAAKQRAEGTLSEEQFKQIKRDLLGQSDARGAEKNAGNTLSEFHAERTRTRIKPFMEPWMMWTGFAVVLVLGVIDVGHVLLSHPNPSPISSTNSPPSQAEVTAAPRATVAPPTVSAGTPTTAAPSPTDVPNAAPATVTEETSTPVTRQSFDCSKAHFATELTICNTASLSALDTEYSGKYHALMQTLKARGATDEVAEVRQYARKFLKDRNACDASIACISDEYQAAIKYVTEYAQ